MRSTTMPSIAGERLTARRRALAVEQLRGVGATSFGADRGAASLIEAAS